MSSIQNQILQGDNLPILKSIPDRSCRLIYIDPPFNSGKVQTRDRIKVKRDEEGTRKGFAGARYAVTKTDSHHFNDDYIDFIGFIKPRIEEAYRILTDDGSLFFHIDYREVHYVKVFLDGVFGRASFINELIWSYDYGAKPKTRWPAKHDTILWYAKDPKRYIFNYDFVDRIPYLAPKLVGPEKAARGKVPTDVWWMTIVPTNSHEKTGYPTQKPLRLLKRIVNVHSRAGDTVLDFFAGSGTLGEAAAVAERRFILVDESAAAIDTMEKRLAFANPEVVRVDATTLPCAEPAA